MKPRLKHQKPAERCPVKRDQEVVVIAGSHRGKRGKVLRIVRHKLRVVVEGIAMMKKHLRKSKENPEGAIIELEGSLHWSNVMSVERFEARAQKREAKKSS